MASARPHANARASAKRPFYVVLALAVALVFGAGSWMQGCDTIAYYRIDTVDYGALAERVADGEARADVEAHTRRLFDVLDAARNRALPLGVGAFVLGAAMVLLAARTFGRRPGARGALVQVVAVQGALAIAAYTLTTDVRAAEGELRLALTRATAPQRPLAEHDVALLRTVFRVAAPAALGLRSLAALLVVFALTRPRARAYLDPPGGPPVGDALEP